MDKINRIGRPPPILKTLLPTFPSQHVAVFFPAAIKTYASTFRYVKSQRHTIQVDYMEYMDELASLIGVKPDVKSLLFKDPKLAWEVFFGPCTPYQYRLQGPGKWDGARTAILTQHDRIIKPLKTRPTTDLAKPSMLYLGLKWVVLISLTAVVYGFWF